MYNREVINGELIRLSFANGFFWAYIDIFLPVLPQYYHSVGLNAYEVGMVIGATAVAGMLFRLVAGKAIDRYGAAIVGTVGLVVSTLAAGGYSFAQTLLPAVVCSFGQGIGLACFSPAGITMATLLHREEHITDVFAVYTLFGILGASLTTATANWLYASYGIKVIIGAGCGLALLSLLSLPKRPTLRVTLEKAASRPALEIAGNPGVYVPTCSTFATSICFAGSMTFLPMLMLGHGIRDFNLFFLTYSVVVVVVRLFVRQICDWFGVLRLELMAVLLMGATMLAAVWAYSWPMLLLSGLLAGASGGIAFPAMGTTITASTEPVNRGTAFGIFTTASDIGFVIGATGLGFAAGAWGYDTVFIIAGVYALAYAVLHRVWLGGKVARLKPSAG